MRPITLNSILSLSSLWLQASALPLPKTGMLPRSSGAGSSDIYPVGPSGSQSAAVPPYSPAPSGYAQSYAQVRRGYGYGSWNQTVQRRNYAATPTGSPYSYADDTKSEDSSGSWHPSDSEAHVRRDYSSRYPTPSGTGTSTQNLGESNAWKREAGYSLPSGYAAPTIAPAPPSTSDVEMHGAIYAREAGSSSSTSTGSSASTTSSSPTSATSDPPLPTLTPFASSSIPDPSTVPEPAYPVHKEEHAEKKKSSTNKSSLPDSALEALGIASGHYDTLDNHND